MNDFNNMLAERNKALEEGDLKYIQRTIGTTDPEILEMILHKARYECLHCSREKRLESGEWLRKNDYKRFDGSPVLPEGELPE